MVDVSKAKPDALADAILLRCVCRGDGVWAVIFVHGGDLVVSGGVIRYTNTRIPEEISVAGANDLGLTKLSGYYQANLLNPGGCWPETC